METLILLRIATVSIALRSLLGRIIIDIVIIIKIT